MTEPLIVLYSMSRQKVNHPFHCPPSIFVFLVLLAGAIEVHAVFRSTDWTVVRWPVGMQTQDPA